MIYLSIENLNGLNEAYELNITLVDIFTNFKVTMERLPMALMNSISKEVMYDIENRVRRQCLSASSNIATDAIGAYVNPDNTMTCILEGTMDGMKNTAHVNSAQLKYGLMLCYKLTVTGVGMITGGCSLYWQDSWFKKNIVNKDSSSRQ